MKIIRLSILFTAIIFLSGCSSNEKKDYLKYVDLLVGTGPATTPSAAARQGDKVNNGQTIPAVTAPFGMTQWTPQTQSTEKKCVAPFYWGTVNIQGFRATHWTSGSCVQDYGSFTFFPTVRGEAFRFLPEQRETLYMYDIDNTTPAYFTAIMPEYNILAEVTSTARSGFFRFSWLDPENATIIIDVNSDEGEGFIRIDTERNEVTGYNPVHRIYNGHGKPAGFSGYFVATFDKPIVKTGTYAENEFFNGVNEQQNKEKIGAYVSFNLSASDAVKMKVGTSFTSIDNARLNMEAEIPHWDFDKTKQELENTWNELLGRINVEGSSNDDMYKFYTAMYHSMLHPRLYSDVNGAYPRFGGGGNVEKAEGFDYYCDFSNWDIYRAQMPLVSLVAPKQYNDMVKSLIVKAEQGGWLPIFPMWNSYTSAMIGDHSTSVIADALAKGFEFDVEKAYHYMRRNAFEVPADEEEYIDGKGRRALQSYLEFGYIPLEDEVVHAFHRREQVSRTMEYAYNDWAVAQVAQKLGKTSDYNELMARALNYTNVFDAEKGWVCGRYADGSFTDDFSADRTMYYITEGTPKHYVWHVQHDVPGLIEMMGGREVFSEKLNSFIDNKEYWHGNEPSHHIPFLFNYIGRWDKTQKTVKFLLQNEYSTGSGGLSGNDDAGQMSAWFVFGSMGFYPVNPGSNEYQLSSPVFDRVTLNLDKDFYSNKNFTIQTSPNNRYGVFSKVKLNGKEIKPVITHDELRNGGKLEFVKQ